MERWAPPPARERPRRRPGQPSFSSTLLDAICDSLDDQPGGPGTTVAAARSAGSAQKKHEAALHCYYYKPSLAASHRAAPAPADDCSGRGYFSSSEVEYSLRRLRPIRTSGGVGAALVAPEEKPPQQQPAAEAVETKKFSFWLTDEERDADVAAVYEKLEKARRAAAGNAKWSQR